MACIGRGVVLGSELGIFNCVILLVAFAGIAVTDASDIGGDGGVGVSETDVDVDFGCGGVDKVGDDKLVGGDTSETGERGRFVRITPPSARRSFPCVISASIFISETSSRSR